MIISARKYSKYSENFIVKFPFMLLDFAVLAFSLLIIAYFYAPKHLKKKKFYVET